MAECFNAMLRDKPLATLHGILQCSVRPHRSDVAHTRTIRHRLEHLLLRLLLLLVLLLLLLRLRLLLMRRLL